MRDLPRELPGCRMEKYSGARPRFGLGGSSGPPASACRCNTLSTAGLGGSPMGMARVGCLQPACRGGGSGRSRAGLGAGMSLPMSPASLPWIPASEPRSFAGVENPGQDSGGMAAQRSALPWKFGLGSAHCQQPA